MADQRTFQISLAMAGAISAGAYSGGVLDFLFEALDAWYAAKKAEPEKYPSHDVVITAIAGASAGAITGALGAAAIRFGIPGRVAAGKSTAGYTQQAMYDAWVVNIDMLGVDGYDGLLSTSDLEGEGEVASLLNSNVLEHIGHSAFGYTPNLRPNHTPLLLIPYISKRLHIYLTISNLRGVPYEVLFSGSTVTSGYGMLNHGDRAHFVVSNLGSSPYVSSWADGDIGVDLDVKSLPSKPGSPEPLHPDWSTCLTAAMASSAFPVGLAPRMMSVSYLEFARRSWPFEDIDGVYFTPTFPSTYRGDAGTPGIYEFSCVDGGVINNEPFEYAHKALLDQGSSHNNPTAIGADRAVIMIDPFPELPDFDVSGDSKKLDIISILVRLFGGLKDQARFKPSELAAALDEHRYSRYLIGPRRDITVTKSPGQPPVTVPAENAIASGLLGGFGGFLSRKFRDYDYQLGRRNCQQFLRESLALDIGNPVVMGWPEDAAENPAFRPTGSTTQRCVIPLVGNCAQPVSELAVWPRIDDADIDAMLKALDRRVDRLFPRFQQNLPGRFARMAAALVWKARLKEHVVGYAEWTVKSDLIKRDQYESIVLATDAHRAVLAALASPKYDYCKASYLGRVAGMAEQSVKLQILDPAEKLGLVSYSSRNGAWTLAARKQGFLAGVAEGIFVGAPTVAK